MDMGIAYCAACFNCVWSSNIHIPPSSKWDKIRKRDRQSDGWTNGGIDTSFYTPYCKVGV